jgi:hypothetical protein
MGRRPTAGADARRATDAGDHGGSLGRGVRWGAVLSAPVWAGLAFLLLG